MLLFECLYSVYEFLTLVDENEKKARIIKLVNDIMPRYLAVLPGGGINQTVQRKQKIIVSMTTLPERIESVWMVVICLLHQSMKPDKIILWLDEGREWYIPERLQKLTKRGLEIRYREDIGPHTKYYYAMKEYPDDFVVTVDDDQFYRANLIERLWKTYLAHEGAVCAFWVWRFKVTSSGKVYPRRTFEDIRYTNEDIVSHYLLPLGVGGVLYPPRLMTEEIFSKDIIRKLSLKQDDIWLKAMEILSDVKVARVKGNYTPNIFIQGTQQIALSQANEGGGENDRYLQDVFSYYNLGKRLLAECE